MGCFAAEGCLVGHMVGTCTWYGAFRCFRTCPILSTPFETNLRSLKTVFNSNRHRPYLSFVLIFYFQTRFLNIRQADSCPKTTKSTILQQLPAEKLTFQMSDLVGVKKVQCDEDEEWCVLERATGEFEPIAPFAPSTRSLMFKTR